MRSSETIKKTSLAVSLVFVAVAIIIFPKRYIASCMQGVLLWAECVLPSLFPFMVISLILIKTGIAEKASLPLQRVSSFFGLPPISAVCFVISIFSGYPAGSKIVAEFYERGMISESDAKRLSILCSTSGPLFIIGSIGIKMLKDQHLGYKLLLAHAVSVICVSLIFALIFKNKSSCPRQIPSPTKNILQESFLGAINAVLSAGAFITFFCVVAQVVYDFKLLYPLEYLLGFVLGADVSDALCRGLIEVTSGCNAVACTDSRFTLPVLGFLVTFGGVSILLQQLSYLISAKIKPLNFVAAKLLQAIICFLILLI